MRRMLLWALSVLVPVGVLRLLHLTWIIVLITIVLVVVALVVSASRRRPKRT
ncbi:MAG TPA: hypothetical protein VHX59_06670 [Mycobacteriales bacterium]|nr:hypothetical protein [Mycobacteriales bacterium]